MFRYFPSMFRLPFPFRSLSCATSVPSGSQYSVSQLACFWIIACAVVKVQLLWMMGFPIRFPFQFHIRFHPSMNPENDTEQSTLSTDFLCDAVRLLSTHPFRCLTCMCPAFASLHAFAVHDSFYVSSFVCFRFRFRIRFSHDRP